MRKNLSSFLIASSIAGIVILSGCSTSTTPPANSGSSNPLPGAGSSFTYIYTSVDTNGVTSAPSDSTYTVISDSLNYAGKTNVLAVQGANGSISYYHLESNGDISIYINPSSFASSLPIPLPISTNWFVIPIGSGVEQTSTIFDTTLTVPISGNNTPIEASIKTDAKSLGPSSVPAAGSLFACTQGSIAITLSATTSLFGLSVPVYSAVATTTIWYSKSLKYYPERTDGTVITSTFFGNSTTSDTYLLNSYSVK